MEDHHNYHHHHHDYDLQEKYGITDLRHLISEPRSAGHFTSIPLPPLPTAELFTFHHRNLTPLYQQHYEMMMFNRDIMPCTTTLHDFASTTTDSVAPTTGITVGHVATTTAAASAATASASTPPLSGGLEAETTCCIGGDASTGRWPRQETLTLLDVRSRLNTKFKEANQKGPVWDEVSRIMSEEHGYHRSGKKCREKFENLYKYYKKTKEGKAGRKDGKHYRFFRQLEALYGENINHSSIPESNFCSNIRLKTSNINTPYQANHENCCLGFNNSTDFDTTSSDDDDNDHNSSIERLMGINNESMLEKRRNKRKSGRSLKVKIEDLIDSQMKKLMEKQEEWLDKLMETMEQKERERVLREEEWRKQEVNRLEREHKFWAKERAWVEARDAALIESLQQLTGREIKGSEPHEGAEVAAEMRKTNEYKNEDEIEILNSTVEVDASWKEPEITRLQHLRDEMETWEEIANKMTCYGYERTALMCKEKWESISSIYYAKEGNKKKKENSRCYFYLENNGQSSLYNQGSTYCDINDHQRPQTNDGSSPSISNVCHADTCFPFWMSEGVNLWENYGLKLNNANQDH